MAAGGIEPYAPLGVLKPLGRDIWMVDGPVVRARRFLGALPLTTRMTAARLPDGRLWLHAPVDLTPGLAREIGALGRVAALVLPNRWCAAALADWQAAFPGAVTWGAPGLGDVAESCGVRIDQELAQAPPSAWSGGIAQVLVRTGLRTEAVFLHRPSRTLVLSDLVQNFERGWWPGGLLRRALCSAAGSARRPTSASPASAGGARFGRRRRRSSAGGPTGWCRRTAGPGCTTGRQSCAGRWPGPERGDSLSPERSGDSGR